ncbi:MAG: glycoside hydrolase family 31 protein [Bacteroidales bacterium]|nr:glycoside hydrolase family 31 protein [Bacteroidales bacterium]
MTYRHILLITLGATLGAQARVASPESITTTTADGRTVTVTAINPNILKVTNMAPGEQPLPSRATVLTNEGYRPDIVSVGHFTTTLTTSAGVTAIVDDRTGALTITAGPGKVVTDPGLRTLRDGRTELALSTTSTGSMYGAGERGHKLNLRGDTLVMFNRQNYGYTGSDPRINQMNITMPLFVSTDGFALVFDDYARAEMILGNPVKYITENPRPVTYYFVNGASTLADVTEQLTALTGRQDLTPFWSLGYITSKYGYHDQAETVGVVDTLKRAGYPVDGIVLDLYWYGKEQDMGRLAWDPEQWPNPAKMLAGLKARGVNLVAISQPYVLRNGRAIDNYNELTEKGLLLKDTTGAQQEVKIWVGEGGMFDVSNPDTRAWLSDRYRKLTDTGITGWWGDLGEPEVHPLTGMHANGLTAPLYHNQYGNDWSEIIYDLFKKEYPDTRLMTMMRGGTTGLQRYSVYPWSTDVSRSWGGLEPQVRIMLNSGLSGLGYMGHDVGGFAVDPDNAYIPELYVRWLQLGLFSPILRTHAQQYAEPYKYPQYASIIAPLIKERYRWLPYNYTLAWENASKGYPLVRPLNFTEPGHAYDSISDEFLWGPDVLVAPVMTEGTVERDITFPAGQWVDMADPTKVFDGHTTVTYPAPLEVLPLFARAGAFIPMADYRMGNTGDYNPARLTVQYYPVAGVDSEFTMFDDDRVSTGTIARGDYRLITFTGKQGGNRISIEAKGTYPGAPLNIDLVLVINRAAGPATFRVNGRNMKAKYDAAAHTLTLRLRWPVDRLLTLESKDFKTL